MGHPVFLFAKSNKNIYISPFKFLKMHHRFEQVGPCSADGKVFNLVGNLAEHFQL